MIGFESLNQGTRSYNYDCHAVYKKWQLGILMSINKKVSYN